jgi:hypothetical protein
MTAIEALDRLVGKRFESTDFGHGMITRRQGWRLIVTFDDGQEGILSFDDLEES